MASTVTNRTVSIYIDQTAAEKSAERLRLKIEKLTQSIEKGEKAGKDMSDNIAKLDKAKAELNQVDQVIAGKMAPSLRMVSDQVSKLRNELRNMSKDAPEYAAKFEAFQKANARLRDMNTELNGVRKEMQNLNKPSLWSKFKGGFMQSLGIGTGWGLVTQGIGLLKDFISQGSEMAAQMEGVQTAFNRLNDPNLLANLRKATKGTVSDLELMKKAVSFNNYSLPLDKMGEALKFARIRAKETGDDVNYLVNSIVTGIGRQSPLILDNLGISTKRVAEEFQKTGNFADAAFKIIQEETAKSGADLDTYGERVARMNATIDNQQTKMGKLFNTIADYAKAAGMDLLNLNQAAVVGRSASGDLAAESYQSQVVALYELRKAKEEEAKYSEEIQQQANEIQLKNLQYYQDAYAKSSLNGQREIREQTQKMQQAMVDDAKNHYIIGTRDYTNYLASIKAAFAAFATQTKNSAFDIMSTNPKGLNLGELNSLTAAIDQQLAAPDLTTEDKAKVLALKKKRERAQEEINKILNVTPHGSGRDKKQAQRQAEQELKSVQEQFKQLAAQVDAMQLEAEGTDADKAQAQVQAVIDKYTELIAKAKKYGAELAGLNELEKKELDLLYSKQFTERSGREYDDSLKDLKEFYDEQALLVDQNFIAGKTTAEQHAAELKRIEEEELQGRIVLAKDYAPTVKQAAEDVEKTKTEAVKQGVADRKAALDQEQKDQENAQKEEQARLRLAVIMASKGSKAEMDAQIAILKKGLEDKKQQYGEYSEQYQEAVAETNQKIEDLEIKHWQRVLGKIADIVGQVGAIFDKAIELRDQSFQQSYDREVARNEKQKDKYQEMLDQKKISQEQYDKYIANLDQEQDKKDKEFKLEKFKRDKQAALISANIQIAEAVLRALASSPPPYNYILAGLVGAAGAVQLAQIATQKPPTYRRGGLFKNNKKGGVVAGAAHEQGGIDMIDSKTGRKVGEMEGGETYMLLSKKVTDANRDIINRLLAESMSGGSGRVGWASERPAPLDYGRAIETIHYTTHYKNGGMVAVSAQPVPAGNTTRKEDNTEVLKALTMALNKFNDNAGTPVKANVVWTELEAKRKQYERLTKTASLKR